MTALEVTFADDELAQIVIAAERRGVSVSDYIRTTTLTASRRKLSQRARDEAILELAASNWSHREIALRLRIDRRTVSRVLVGQVTA
jgi:DNA-binding NarL/FixJ family response regulator